MEELKGVHYDAFISYRHSELDSFVAENLHKKLEKFRLPKSVRSKVGNGKTGISRVFRDVDELPLSDNLSEPINNAIANSDFLITICTPRYPESRWCMKEIELFLQTHDRDHILVVLAEDEPVRSFPKILTYEEYTAVDENGNEVRERKYIEPLAADTRGSDKKEILKAMDTAVLKLCAAIFGLNYDDLRQRHREQKIKRMVAIFGSIGAAVLIFAVFATVMLIRISRQNALITEQYAELNDKYAGSMANAAQQLFDAGRRKDAVYAVRNALPDEAGEHYNANALRKLYEGMRIYDNGTLYYPESCYETEEEVYCFDVSCDNRYILINCVDSIHIYDTETEKQIKEIRRESDDPSDCLYAAFCGTDGVIATEDDRAVFVRLSDDETKDIPGVDGSRIFSSSPQGDVTLAVDETEALVTGIGADGNILYDFNAGEFFNRDDLSLAGDIRIKEGKVLAFFGNSEEFFIMLFDALTGECISSLQGDGAMQLCGDFEEDNIIFSATPIGSYSSTVISLDASTRATLWAKEQPSFFTGNIFIGEDYVYLNDNYQILVLGKKRGEKFNYYENTEQITECWLEDDGLCYLTGAGSEYKCDPYYTADFTAGFFSIRPTGHYVDALYRNGEIYFQMARASYISRYSRKKDAPSPYYSEEY